MPIKSLHKRKRKKATKLLAILGQKPNFFLLINVLIWNVRGIISSKTNLFRIIKKYKPSMVVLLKPSISVDRIGRWARWFHFKNSMFNVTQLGGKFVFFEMIEFSLSTVSS